MQNYQDSLEDQNNSNNQLHNQCNSLLQNVDFKQQANRQWIAKCYRKLNQFVNQNAKVRFNLTNDSSKLPEIATKYAFSIRPFQFNQGLQTFSKQMEQSFAAKKKCQMPLIYKSENNQWVLLKVENGIISIRQNNRFNLRIQAQEKSNIVITYENNHPLRVNAQRCSYHYQKATLQIIPPSNICIVVTKSQSYTIDTPQSVQRTQTVPFKLPSNAIKIEVAMTGNKKGRLNQGQGWLDRDIMVRPQQTFDHGLSNSQGSNVHPYIGIQTESRSRD